MSVVRFCSGPVKFALGWLDKINSMIRQHLTQQGMLMKMNGNKLPLHEARRHGNGPEELCWSIPLGAGENPPPIQVGNHLPAGVVLEDGGGDDEKRHGKGVWLRKIEKGLKRFDASLEWARADCSSR